MVIVSKGKTVHVTAEPEDDEEKPTKDLIKVMKSELHKRNEKKVTEEDEEEKKKEDDNS